MLEHKWIFMRNGFTGYSGIDMAGEDVEDICEARCEHCGASAYENKAVKLGCEFGTPPQVINSVPECDHAFCRHHNKVSKLIAQHCWLRSSDLA